MIIKAKSIIRGGLIYPDISGIVLFTQFINGVEVTAKIHNLPDFSRDGIAIGPFGFHLHNGKSCEVGDLNNQFPLVGSHYNPYNQPHGNHAGDFPSLMPLSNGTAMIKFFSDKFRVDEIIGLVIVIHQGPDNYLSEPAGESGEKIACGLIEIL